MAIENISPVAGTMIMNLIIDLSFAVIVLSIIFWQIRKGRKIDRLKTALMKQIIKDKQSENKELESEIWKLKKILIFQNWLEGEGGTGEESPL